MHTYYADLHVHLGSAAGRPVKISASRQLTLTAIADHAARIKGLHMVGIVDTCTAGGLADLKAAIKAGHLTEQRGGGLLFQLGDEESRAVVLIPACEIEIREPGRPAVHWLAYFGRLQQVETFATALAQSVRNPYLSTQRTSWLTAEFVDRVAALGGLPLPAHAFTPHKGLFGAAASHLTEVLPEQLLHHVQAVELGLSADSAMADRLSELHSRTFLSNSDAHSLDTIGREHNRLQLQAPSFDELVQAIRGEGGRAITANYGLDPRLGKYYRTTCLRCGIRTDAPPPILTCPACGSVKVVTGVADRLAYLADCSLHNGPERPPYVPQVPLRLLPGLGPRRLERLVATFGSELAVLHEVTAADLGAVVESDLVALIMAARTGTLRVEAGGGGIYGRVQRPLSTGATEARAGLCPRT